MKKKVVLGLAASDTGRLEFRGPSYAFSTSSMKVVKSTRKYAGLKTSLQGRFLKNHLRAKSKITKQTNKLNNYNDLGGQRTEGGNQYPQGQ